MVEAVLLQGEVPEAAVYLNEVLLAEAIKADFAQPLILLTHAEECKNQVLYLVQVHFYTFFDVLLLIGHMMYLDCL